MADLADSLRARAVDAWRDAPQLTVRTPEDPLAQIVREASKWLLKHPVAAQALFSALVAEGRRFAQTSEGQRWREALADSELVRRGRALWESSVLNFLEDAPDVTLPSAISDAIVQAVSHFEWPLVKPLIEVDSYDDHSA